MSTIISRWDMGDFGLGNDVLSKSLIVIHGKQVFSALALAFAGAQHQVARVASDADPRAWPNVGEGIV